MVMKNAIMFSVLVTSVSVRLNISMRNLTQITAGA